MKNILSNIIENKNDLDSWIPPNLSIFSDGIKLFDYQIDAIQSIIKSLYTFYQDCNEDKQKLFNQYVEYGLNKDSFDIKKYKNLEAEKLNIIDKRYKLFQHHFTQENNLIQGYNFINRLCLWMATGSGKSLVIIKTIELLDYLICNNIIPKKDIMLLLPSDKIIEQFKNEIIKYNRGKSRLIDFVNLKNYEHDKNTMAYNYIKVYYYRSDLIRAERKQTEIDYKTYLNHGKWYLFLDEAHRGEKQNSNMQDYIAILCKNGFLFNFSATFTDEIDHISTCYNFNLERFITKGYGKNVYISNSTFDFNSQQDELSKRDKQKQVLKSLFVFTMIKKSKLQGYYHDPLILTLVNSVNTEEADLKMFFKELEKIATNNNLDNDIFNEVKTELTNELLNHTGFQFGNEKLQVSNQYINDITIQDIRINVFNSTKQGSIEIIEGEKSKEIVLQLQNANAPFALIKIGDADKFKKEALGQNYTEIKTIETKTYFKTLNNNKDINLLIGSRAFYEGWDSNRPNVVNFINIGGKDARKFVLQGLGRGVRIEPTKNNRQRLKQNNPNKNNLLETLFVFATDKKSISTILTEIDNQKSNDDMQEVSLINNPNKPFDLLIPVFKEIEEDLKIRQPFTITKTTLDSLKNYIQNLDTTTLMLKYAIDKKQAIETTQYIQSMNATKHINVYENIEYTFKKIIKFTELKTKTIEKVKELQNEIIHFKHIKIANALKNDFLQTIEKVKKYKKITNQQLKEKVNKGEMKFEDALQEYKNLDNKELQYNDLTITYIAEHYYLPVIYSNKEKVDYIKHIIKVPSEVAFIKNLNKKIETQPFNCTWMFSKIDENIDTLSIPYLHDDSYKNFYPDFIFWIIKNNKYRIVFIDPKGGTQNITENKIDGFKKLFEHNNQQKTFSYKNYTISFELYFIGNHTGGDAYKNYWLNQNDFLFLNK
ncbi:MAG: DEAD/DEAH box helicase family protein [Limnohabitans sp.]|nr:DEAD/DEAH box helicase family protein [Limnohabitans sp.]